MWGTERILEGSSTHQSALWLDKGPVLAVHLVVQAARVAEVVARSVPPPQRGGGGSAVHTFTPLCAQNSSGGKQREIYIIKRSTLIYNTGTQGHAKARSGQRKKSPKLIRQYLI